MPGSCESDQGSSSSLISSLRKFRFQNKAKQAPQGETSSQSTSNSGTAISSASSTAKGSASRPVVSPKTTSTPYNNPLAYRKYENSHDAHTLLRDISAKFQILFKNSHSLPTIDLKLTPEESKKLKETVLQHTSLSLKWSSCVNELPVTDPNEILFKVKRTYLWDLSKRICEVLNTSFAKTGSAQFTADNPPPVRTYSRNKSVENPTKLNTPNKPLPSETQNYGTMDDYEEFCEKEQSLRKLLDAFPGADIMEAQDILVKCQWDLNKAIQEAQNQPLRTTRKRSFSGAYGAQTSMPSNIPNQKSVNPQQIQSPSNKFPEEIVLDSSDEDEVNGNTSNQMNKSVVSNKQGVHPPAKRARRLISTDSSEDEAAVRSPATAAYSQSQLTVQQKVPSTQQKILPSNQQKASPAVQQKLNSSSLQKPSLSVQKSVTVQPSEVRTPTSYQNNSSVDKTINVPSSISIKPVSVTPSSTSEQSSSSTMPNLPKGLVITQVGNTDNQSKTASDMDVDGDCVNGNHPNNITSNSKKSAHLVRIKPSNSLDTTAANSVITTSAVSSNSRLSVTPVNKALSVTPVGKSVSIIPVSQTVTVPSSSKVLSITPVGGNVASKEKSPFSSSTEDEGSSTKDIKRKPRIKNIESLKDSDNLCETNNADKSAASKPKKKGRPPKVNVGKRKKFCSDDDDDEEYGNEDIYDSEDSDCGENLTAAHSAVLKFFQEASAEELGSIPGCSKKKIEAIMNLRPFNKWLDLVDKLRNDKALSTDLLNGAKKVLDMRNAITKLMTKCQKISFDMEGLVENLKENKESCTGYVGKQPDLLNERMHLTGYQMLGLNWLLLMHNQQVNGILADEMGLGKTVQAISFLAYLKQIDEMGPHLIVVPSSTLDNWKKELETWWPTVSVICYHGQQESRRELRMQILNDEVEDFDVMITTYNMVTSSAEDRSFFKRLEFNYVVFDEAHMLKNMSSQRYTNLMRIKAPRRLLLTGTPLQNNLVELMSLLIFAMPHMFSGKTEQIKQMFTCVAKADGSKNSYEKDRIDHAKRIMKPFVLRRLKRDVLKELPDKYEETRYCAMVDDQEKKYKELVKKFSAEVQDGAKQEKDASSSGAGMMMQLRRAANHPLLLRRFYDDDKILVMATEMIQEPTHSQSDPNIIFEDMAVMSDFELHKLCLQYKSIKSHALPDSTILSSGKFKVLDELLPDLIKEDHRILLFSQFTMVLDIIQEYMHLKNYRFLRLDGQVPVPERQQLIDEFNNDPEILVFLLSTRAGGLGINLTAADTVILHDIDFNPYNDKQAEDRCHRVGQIRDVKVIRLISENTIEEGILQRAKEKLKLERDIHDEDADEEADTASVAMLLRDALGLKAPGKS